MDEKGTVQVLSVYPMLSCGTSQITPQTPIQTFTVRHVTVGWQGEALSLAMCFPMMHCRLVRTSGENLGLRCCFTCLSSLMMLTHNSYEKGNM